MRRPARPRVAMFHGGGSTSKIFQMQCESIEQRLASRFELVYFDAPFQSGPGKGILPFFSFEEWGPYLSWFTNREDGEEYPDGTAGNYDDEEGIERIIRLMRESEPGGKWVGCLGFSQGTRVVAGLLLWQQLRKKKGVEVGENIDLQFGVLCMGAYSPMTSTIPECKSFSSNSNFPCIFLFSLSANKLQYHIDMVLLSALLEWDEKDPSPSLARKDELIKIPTLHLHGLKDAFLSQARSQMNDHFDPNTITCVEIDYHHAMPWHKSDVSLLVENIERMPFSV
ncbi:Esterase citA [Golovinomyces cichoracearum]|uniref:Esterase citA n=1 Tax=Golovinomyces cichoracearum TaxID=62708 RepID=A0A420IJ42_9PEZI|nr:Esterase citA [Golovinomyces cichoracearum]